MRFDDASRALVEFAASRHNAFHSSEAADNGLSDQRLRRAGHNGDLLRLHPRIWSVSVLGRPPGQAVRASTLRVGGAAAAHHGAAWLHRWVDRPPREPTIWVPRNGIRLSDPPRMIWSKAIDPAIDVTEVDGIRCLNPAATLCLIGRVVNDRTLSVYVDEFLRTNSIQWLHDTLDRLRLPNEAGTARLSRVLADPRRNSEVTESVMERRLADVLSRAGLGPFELQHPVAVAGKAYRLDVAFPEICVGIEAHSRRFHWGVEAEEADNERDLALAPAGWQVVYVTWSQLRRPAELVARLRPVLAAAA